MTPLAEMIPAMTDADLKALRLNAVRLTETGSPVQMEKAADIIPLIDAENAARASAAPKPVKKARPAPKKKVAPVTGHQTALPDAKTL
ncbi:MAG TPA: hypothetical protein PLQ03_08715 [Brevundimonas sp.]|uniref:hypothetical protein n=1 Tax=Brevundimonas sp. TaxID=1871086 RepID=UPI002616D31A|nr:hypothetical protein [Brevundimonas sp.]HRO33476.1 hypothetical protein [Brevundimonas sp.]